MKTLSKVIIIFIIFIAVSTVSIYFYAKSQLFSPISNNNNEFVFEVKDGQGVMEIVDNLEKEGFVKNKWITVGYLKFKNMDKSLKAGTFLLSKNLTPVQVLDIISSGKNALKKVTIVEGWTLEEVADYLDKRSIVQREDFLIAVNVKKWNYDFLNGAKSLEGFLFPDTYYISYKADASEIIKKMLDNFDKKLTSQTREDIKKKNMSIFDVITLASVVEKEVSKEEDRKTVAGLLLKRIFLGKPLEVDSTINYITGKDNPQPSFADTRSQSEYNTYLNKGLPPGPICSPSISSINASIYPKETSFLYYLNRQDTKETIFSQTYEEHLQNKYKYLK
ncbi:endolytic transglycosylase MltG [bacterium CG_4_10_14_0_2_um_filter_33_32]|nr:MAG: hypothetical protein AUJ93_02820 [bacterium CG2_30_33_46]PIR68054.1 MAG: endolytic transglycosylase MltG [bacterium CG10_big_fil_rev_8_21_14_0_10_33_18]PIU76727.1 MAG: endolytic transglycosylase MltG [bacterium CG06_land_8_20_14_3_00_33_50]PIW80821.1 MAG: endolytic transglycosylase MltG [bacterium CG_4_8_14_3_um_filter_33_28]PIY85156.1 MAG: endolytic transglycosylase MltG [bacterium CG_4_10_14_0_8_um_filter_33_57]PIZ85361.1 MAG: endolytic transglycosylase MltG [bacterium CG_4_10_14_0_2